MLSTCSFINVRAPSMHVQEASGTVDVHRRLAASTRCMLAEQVVLRRCTNVHRHTERPVWPRHVCACRTPRAASTRSSLGTRRMPPPPLTRTLDTSQAGTIDAHAGHLALHRCVCTCRTSRAASTRSLGARARRLPRAPLTWDTLCTINMGCLARH